MRVGPKNPLIECRVEGRVCYVSESDFRLISGMGCRATGKRLEEVAACSDDSFLLVWQHVGTLRATGGKNIPQSRRLHK